MMPIAYSAPTVGIVLPVAVELVFLCCRVSVCVDSPMVVQHRAAAAAAPGSPAAHRATGDGSGEGVKGDPPSKRLRKGRIASDLRRRRRSHGSTGGLLTWIFSGN